MCGTFSTGKVLYECKYCGTGYVKNPARMKRHLVSCPKTPSYLKVKTATSLSAGSEAASKPSASVDTETSALEGACDQRANSSLSSSSINFKDGQNLNFETNFRSLLRFNESN
jgi:hypothetical protein